MQENTAPEDRTDDTGRDDTGRDDTGHDDGIADRRARAFATALRSFERDGDPGALLARFGEGATAERLDGRGRRTDLEAFWQEYRSPFDRVATTFRNAVETGGSVVLEWDSDAVLAGGGPVTVRGVTVLDLADTDTDTGTDGGDGAGAVVALRTYYDTAVFVTPPRTRG